MFKKVTPIKPCANAPKTLRNIADQMERGEIESDNVTIISGTEVFQCGEYSIFSSPFIAILNMTIGISKLTHAVHAQLSE